MRRTVTRVAWSLCLGWTVLSTLVMIARTASSYRPGEALLIDTAWIGCIVLGYAVAHAVDRISI